MPFQTTFPLFEDTQETQLFRSTNEKRSSSEQEVETEGKKPDWYLKIEEKNVAKTLKRMS